MVIHFNFNHNARLAGIGFQRKFFWSLSTVFEMLVIVVNHEYFIRYLVKTKISVNLTPTITCYIYNKNHLINQY